VKNNKLVYRKQHLGCTERNCNSYSAYIRVQKKWTKAGEFNSRCSSFTPVDDIKTYDEIQRIALQELFKHKLNYWKKLGIKFKV